VRARVELRQAVALVVAGKVIDGNYVWIAMQMPHAWIVKIRHVKEMGDRHFRNTAVALQRQPEIVFRIEVRKR
jgi:hypothetical protein